MEQFKKQKDLQKYFDNAYGYAVFDKITKVGFAVGGAGGFGEVFIRDVNGARMVGESTVMQVSFGFQFGGQIYSEIIFFQAQRDFEDFTSGNFEFAADANVIALTASASAKATTMGNQNITAGMSAAELSISQDKCTYTKGLAVFTLAVSGLMYQATLSGQKFSYKEL